MTFKVELSDESVVDIKNLRAFERKAVIDQMHRILESNPTLESKAKVKKLRQPAPTQYRLRVGGVRIFYDVEDESVSVRRIIAKDEAAKYYEEESE